MADRGGKRLGRLLRVRTLQLGQVRAREVAAAARVDGETALSARIAELAATVAPRETDAGSAAGMAAAACYRDRLHASAIAVGDRVAQAEAGLERARSATREARRDQSAIEKLIARARARATLGELRALEDAPWIRTNRHDPC